MRHTRPRQAPSDRKDTQALQQETKGRKSWANLRPGNRVTVSENGRFPYEATIDLLTEDLTIVWVYCAGGPGRRAFDCREEITISPLPSGT